MTRSVAAAPARVLLGVALLALTLGGCAGESKDREVAQALKQESSAEMLFAKGRAAATIGDLTRAEQYFVAAIKTGGDERKIIKPLLVACITDQRFPVALEYAEQYLYRHPDDVDVRFVAASVHAVLGHADEAQKLLESVVRSRPESAEVHYALATVLYQGGNLERAARHDLEYLKLEPEGEHAAQARARLSASAP